MSQRVGAGVERDAVTLEDRGYAKFKLFNAIVAEGSSYVCRLRDNSVYQAVQQRDLTPDDVQANVVFDGTVLLGETTKGRGTARPPAASGGHPHDAP